MFEDNFFDGYFSLGVIEHFYLGFQPLLTEMRRVLKPGGYLFLTFPAMNSLRNINASRGIYPLFDEQRVELDHFYQFALDPENVQCQFEKQGFRVVKKTGMGSFGGIQNEWPQLQPFISRLHRLPGGLGVKCGIIFDLFFGKQLGHICFMIFRNGGG